jgi:predicted nucleic acid-binding protein
MVKEAVDEGLIRRPAAYALKPNYDAIRRLRRYWDLTARVFDLNLVIFSSGEARHRTAQRVRQQHGLLTNDSLIAAACLEQEIRLLATRDADFDRIPELTVYKPTDIP